MSISSHYNKEEKQVTINISGRFDFSVLDDFRKSYMDYNQVNNYIIDLKKTQYLDSSALGMLLGLRDFAGGDDASISIINTNDEIEKILKITRLNELFLLEDK